MAAAAIAAPSTLAWVATVTRSSGSASTTAASRRSTNEPYSPTDSGSSPSMSTLIPSSPNSDASATSAVIVASWRGTSAKKARLRAPPKLVNTSSTRTPRSWASRMIRAPGSPVMRLYPVWRVFRAPLLVSVTLNSASVVRGVTAR